MQKVGQDGEIMEEEGKSTEARLDVLQGMIRAGAHHAEAYPVKLEIAMGMAGQPPMLHQADQADRPD